MKQRSGFVHLLLAFAAGAMLLLAACDNGTANEPTPVGTADSTPEMTPSASRTPAEASPTAGDATASPSAEPVASTASVPFDELPEVKFVASDGSEAVLRIEVPQPDEYSIGLSGRAELEDDRGMLFLYPWGDHTGSFWMRNTHFDLDIAFVDAELNVITVLQMTADTEDRHNPGEPYLAAIEAPVGWYSAHGIGAGASVEFLFNVWDYYPS